LAESNISLVLGLRARIYKVLIFHTPYSVIFCNFSRMKCDAKKLYAIANYQRNVCFRTTAHYFSHILKERMNESAMILSAFENRLRAGLV